MRIGHLANVLATGRDGPVYAEVLKQAIRGVTTVPRYLSFDHDPLYRFHQWEAPFLLRR